MAQLPTSKGNIKKYVASIDYGTYGTGLASASSSDSNPRMSERVHEYFDSTTKYLKKLSAILIEEKDPSQPWVSEQSFTFYFGSAVLPRLQKNAEEGEKKFTLVVKNIKTEFGKWSNPNQPPVLHLSNNGRSYDIPYSRLIQLYLQDFRKNFVEIFNNRSALIQMTNLNTRWVFSVPSCWSDFLIQQFKLILKDAGFTNKDPEMIEEDDILLIREPEAASIHMLKHLEESNEVATEVLKPGECFLLIDAGAGTVDLTTHKLNKFHQLEEQTIQIGGYCGSTLLDKNFLKLLEDNFGADWIQHLKDEFPYNFETFMGQWVDKKAEIDETFFNQDPNKKNKKVARILLKGEIANAFENCVPADKQDARKSFIGGIGAPYLQLTTDQIIQIFSTTVDEVVKLVETQFNRLDENNIEFRYVFLVGGFGQNKYLRNRIEKAVKDRYADDVEFVSKDFSGKSVYFGGCLAGLDPSLIRSRKSRATIGIETMEMIDDKKFFYKDPEVIRRFVQPWWVSHVMNVFVEKNQTVTTDEVVRKEFEITDRNNNILAVKIYQAMKNDVKYVDDPMGCKMIGQMNVTLVDPKNVEKVVIEMKCGKTVLEVTAFDDKGSRQAISLKFETVGLELA